MNRILGPLKYLLLAFLFSTGLLSFAATQGNFTGRIVAGPKQDGKWIYVIGPKNTLRRVDVSKARVEYAPAIDKKDRSPQAVDSLREGALIQVIATQDDAGEWKALNVQILALARN